MDKGTKGTEIVTLSDYAIAKIGNDAVGSLLNGNLGGSQLQVSDLPKVKIPTGGSTTWLVPPDDAPAKDVEGIVVYQHDLRAMFAQNENGGISNDPPLCTSDDAKVGRGVPGGDCSRCVNAMYGSAGAGYTLRGQGLTGTTILPVGAGPVFFGGIGGAALVGVDHRL